MGSVSCGELPDTLHLSFDSAGVRRIHPGATNELLLKSSVLAESKLYRSNNGHTPSTANCPEIKPATRSATSGSFVPFTIVARCSKVKAMEENSAQALDGELLEVSEIRFDWPQFLPGERIKAGLTEIALGLTMFVALVAFC